MNLPQSKQWAAAYATKEFISVNTCSGLRSCASDPQGEEFFFFPDASDAEIGAGILGALSASRFLSPEEVGSFFDLSSIEGNYESWVERLIDRYNYRSRRSLFKEMKHCTISRIDGVVTMKPTNHEKLEAWSGKRIDSNNYQVIRDVPSDSDLGKALKICFTKCIS